MISLFLNISYIHISYYGILYVVSINISFVWQMFQMFEINIELFISKIKNVAVYLHIILNC